MECQHISIPCDSGCPSPATGKLVPPPHWPCIAWVIPHIQWQPPRLPCGTQAKPSGTPGHYPSVLAPLRNTPKEAVVHSKSASGAGSLGGQSQAGAQAPHPAHVLAPDTLGALHGGGTSRVHAAHTCGSLELANPPPLVIPTTQMVAPCCQQAASSKQSKHNPVCRPPYPSYSGVCAQRIATRRRQCSPTCGRDVFQ